MRTQVVPTTTSTTSERRAERPTVRVTRQQRVVGNVTIVDWNHLLA
ncbi:MAG: hypothetical protein M3Q92_10100 [Actinomycetota bacterium]|nr:hypothetical protein [Actinomycetota bacterium]